jgi:hypothetical protein
LDQSPYTLVASSSSGLPVTITSSTAGVCTVVGSVLTLVSAGTCSLVATQVGGSGFEAASSVASIKSLGATDTISLMLSKLESGSTYSANLIFKTKSGRTVWLSANWYSQSSNCTSDFASQVNAFDPGYCTIDVSVSQSAGWSGISTSFLVQIVLPRVSLQNSGTWSTTGSTSAGIKSTLSPGKVSLSGRAETSRTMKLLGYYSCPPGTIFTNDKLALGCVLSASAAEYVSWGSLDNCSPGAGCFINQSTSAGSYYYGYSNSIYAVEVGDGYYRKGTLDPLSKFFNYVRWNYLDDKSLPTLLASPTLSKSLTDPSQLDLTVGNWGGTPTTKFSIPSTYVEWGYCPKGTALPSSSCYVLQNLTLSGDATLNTYNPRLLSSTTWQIYALVRAINSFGYTNSYVIWTYSP